jgi:hypothetical protein
MFGFIKYFSWEGLLALSFFFYVPTMLRLLKIKYFNTTRKFSRFSMRFLLGLGIATGLLSILIAPNIFFQIIQILLGLGLYMGIAIARIKDPDAWKECETCTYTRSNLCFGFRQFYFPEESEKINLFTDELVVETGTD